MGVELPMPDLSQERVLRFIWGVRPCRRGGLRLESEQLGHVRVIHNYGHGGSGVTLSLGCAAAVSAMLGPPGGERVAVLGGGVSGLSVALELLRAGHSVRVYAEVLAMQTTSAIAGALWFPLGIDFPEPGEARDRFNGILKESYSRFCELLGSDWGVREIDVYEPIGAEVHPEYFEAGVIGPPSVVGAGDPMPPGLGACRVFRSLFVDTTRYLPRLHDEVQRLGAAFEMRRFTDLRSVADLDERIVVNCLGLASGGVFGDAAVFPARGLMVEIEGRSIDYAIHDGFKYIFPREDTLLLGGTYEVGCDGPPADDSGYEVILEHHRHRLSRASV
ncbi:MAG TPA: FAD-binding oxidoreductase [Phycisphaerales bacterium]|nr:FAD-binding oxidoreductase [Phycisphaerales bacterium]